MKISEITITGYKSIRSIEKIKLPQITAIIGANNSGKSNFLDAVYNVIGKTWVTVNNFSEDDVYQRNKDGDFDIKIDFEYPILYHQFKGIEPIPIYKLQFIYTRYKIGEKVGQI